ncbi:MAG: DUF6624 domain-containing protein [Patiriisocius sp.]|uniref:DUF6624 domain-containing protein n=1 Tax=Patiriisocius sp. TaxID=2822396 RepID=UPI003EF9D6A1
MDKDEIWKLGWRMVESSMDEKYEMADFQFDSLIKYSKEMDVKFLTVGLNVKAELGKDNEITKILNDQSPEILVAICEKDLKFDIKPCLAVSKEKVGNRTIQREIIKMYVDDQAIRRNIMKDIIKKYNIDTTQIIKDNSVDVDARNRDRLKQIFKEFGFPTKQLIGKDGMDGIFFIIQHSDSDKEWQKSQLNNIEAAVKNGDLEAENFAYLYDRIKVNNGEKQLYGTQFKNVDYINNIVELAETEDRKNLDVRRREIGLMPIDLYKKLMLKNP